MLREPHKSAAQKSTAADAKCFTRQAEEKALTSVSFVMRKINVKTRERPSLTKRGRERERGSQFFPRARAFSLSLSLSTRQVFVYIDIHTYCGDLTTPEAQDYTR